MKARIIRDDLELDDLKTTSEVWRSGYYAALVDVENLLYRMRSVVFTRSVKGAIKRLWNARGRGL